MARDKSLANSGPDPFGLRRFVEAQDGVYDTVLTELRAGRKTGHWIWFVFPQLRGLGRSPTAQHYGITSLDEARAYLGHEVLGPRLRECAQLVARSERASAREMFGSPDDMKVRSSMTLFGRATDDDAVFRAVLAKFYGDEEDPLTVELLTAAR